MQAGGGLLVSDVIPIYMIIPRYSHNYAQFCQLLNSNLFTHRRNLCSREKPLVKPMAPGSIFIILISYYLVISFAFILLCIFIIKIPKYYLIISIRSHSRKWPYRDWQPLFVLVARIYLFCVGTRDSRVASYWIDTLVLKNWGKYLCYCAASSSHLRGKPMQTRDVAILHIPCVSGRINIGDVTKRFFNSWKLASHSSVHLNLVSFFNNSVMGFAIFEKFSMNLR